MRILVSNDDGVYSPGILALAKAAKQFYQRSRRASVGRDSLCGTTTAKLSPTKTQPVGRFFGSQSPRSKAPRKGRIAGQSSTVGYRLLRCVSISPMKLTLLAPWPFQIPQPRRSSANAVNDALPLPLHLNLNRLPEGISRGRGRGRLSHGKAILG